MSVEHPVPTQRGREVVEGAYDIHLHVMPDVFPRKTTDVELAARFRELGLGGFVLKSHYTATAERAAVVRATTGVDVFGGVTLNNSMGGINAFAVEVCARAGGRMVWLPTFDSVNEATLANNRTATGAPPAWAQLSRELEAKGLVTRPVAVVDADGAVLPEVRTVLRVIADHDMVLCTGHVGAEEARAVVDAAQEAGVRRIVITHPEFPSQRYPIALQQEFAERGCLMERCFGTPYAKRVGWDEMFTIIRAVGVDHSLLSSDLGQPHNPPVEDGLALMADRLLESGFSDAEVHRMAVTNTRSLLGVPEPAHTSMPGGGA